MPITVFDAKTGEPIQADEGQAEELLRSGAATVGAGQTFSVKGSTGRRFDYSGAEALDAIKRGLRFETGDETAARQLQEKYGSTGQEVGAGLLGAARGLSFGLSDVVARGVGVEPETLAGLEEANPTASTFGELAGVGAGLLVPGGQAKAATTLGKLASGASAPVRAVAKLGTAAEKATERGLTKLLGETASQGFLKKAASAAISKGAGSAVEGTAYGLGSWVSEQALGSPEDAAESLVANVGLGALLGGGLGAGFGMVGVAGKAGKDATVRLWESATGEQATTGLARFLKPVAKLQTRLKYGPEAAEKMAGDIDTLLTKDGYKAATIGKDAVDDYGYKIADLKNQIDSSAQDATLAARGKMKKENLIEATRQGDKLKTVSVFENLFGWEPGQGKFGSMLKELRTSEAGMYGGKAQLKFLEDRINVVRNEIKKAITSGDETLVGKTFGHLDDLKRDTARVIRQVKRGQNIGNPEYSTLDRLFSPPNRAEGEHLAGGLYGDIQRILEDEAIFGKKAATMQREVNERWVDHLKGEVYRTKGSYSVKTGAQDFADIYEANPAAFRDYLERAGTIENSMDEKWMLTQLDTEADLVQTIAKYYEAPKLSTAAKKHAQATADFRKLHDEAYGKIRLRNQLQKLDAASQVAIPGIGNAGSMAGGALLGSLMAPEDAKGLGATIGAGAAFLMKPASAIKALAWIEKQKIGLSGKTKAAVDGFTKASKAIGPKVQRMAAPAAVQVFGKTPEERRESYKKKVAQLQAVVSSPDHAVKMAAKNADGDLGAHAPAVVQMANAKAVQAAHYLASKAPKDPSAASTLGRKWEPSDHDLERFARVVRAVEDPKTVLDDMADGKITKEAVDALREIYPGMYSQLLDNLTEKIPELKESATYQQKVALSKMFGIALEPSMDPQRIAMVQGLYSHAEAPSPASGKMRVSGVRSVNPGSMLSDAQRIGFKSPQFA